MKTFYPKTSQECELLLEMGYTLTNIHNMSVCYDEKGNQVISNKKRKRDYKFSHPHYWRTYNVSLMDRFWLLLAKVM